MNEDDEEPWTAAQLALREELRALCQPCPECGYYPPGHAMSCRRGPARTPEELAEHARVTALHRAEAHPDFLYVTTPKVPGEAGYPNDPNDHWYPNAARGGGEWLGTHGVVHWMRRKDAPETRGFWQRYPNTIEQLFTETYGQIHGF